MKTLIILLTCMLTAISSQAASEQTKQSNDSNSEIEQYISSRTTAIDNYYTGRIAELRLRAAADIRLLEIAEQPKPDCVGLDEWAEFAEIILRINGCEENSSHLLKTANKTPAERLAQALNTIAKRKNDILTDSQWRILKLERRKKNAMTVGIEKLREHLTANPQATEQKTTRGVVAGIIYTEDNPIAVIDGTIVKNNENIHGVKIIKIHADKVDFEKDGKNWTQQVRQKLEENWR
ncbi:MAG: hypothetical protein JW715_04385 [Sedimentisphaerales bacterium]|nr:hypothetical protein [Sedimentisphaerales bacterium]